MAERAVAVDAQGREWAGWLVAPDEWTPEDRVAFVPDDPPDGDPETVWYVPADAVRLAPDRRADPGSLGREGG
jgi:hypothetical protein